MMVRNKILLPAISVKERCHSHQRLQPHLSRGALRGLRKETRTAVPWLRPLPRVSPQDVKTQDTRLRKQRCTSKEWCQWAENLHLPYIENHWISEIPGFSLANGKLCVDSACPLFHDSYASWLPTCLLGAVFSGLPGMLRPRLLLPQRKGGNPRWCSCLSRVENVLTSPVFSPQE